MIIQNLKLENYRRFVKLDLEFPENIIGIIGNNGSGKSTIIEAIGWILYGNAIARTEKQVHLGPTSEARPECIQWR